MHEIYNVETEPPDSHSGLTNGTFCMPPSKVSRFKSAVINTIDQATGIKLKELNADGGISMTQFMMRMLSNLLNIRIKNS